MSAIDSNLVASLSPTPVSSTSSTEQSPRMWRQGWARFRRNKIGILGLFLISFVVAVAIASSLIAPYDPNDQTAMINFGARAAPSLLHPFGTDRMGTTC